MKTEDLLRYQREDTGGATSADMQALERFRRALRKGDQEALDDLLTRIVPHRSLAQLVPQLLPIEFHLLTMLLEQHKEINRLKDRLEHLSAGQGES